MKNEGVVNKITLLEEFKENFDVHSFEDKPFFKVKLGDSFDFVLSFKDVIRGL